MDLNPTSCTTTTSFTQTPDTDTETPPQNKPFKSFSFTNGSLKRHHIPQVQPPPVPQPQPQPQVIAVSYKECLKNHAASVGGLALDGCGEFLSSSTATPSDPTSLKCAACGCHRNFHRRDSTLDPSPHLHLSPPFHQSPSQSQSPSSSPVPSPPPVSHLPPSHYYSSVPQMLLSLGTSFPQPSPSYDHQNHPSSVMMGTENPLGRKRFRTKFTQGQKEKMYLFAEKLGWKLQKSNVSLVEEFCNEIGIDRRVLKVWMHNNKHTLRKRENVSTDANGFETKPNYCSNDDENGYNEGGGVHLHVSANGSSSSSSRSDRNVEQREERV